MRPATFNCWGGAQEQPPPQPPQYSFPGTNGGMVWGAPAQPEDNEPEYPNPGCNATCDGCGKVIDRFYHCTQCDDPDLFDLCPACCAAVYLPPDRRPFGLKVPIINHPTHDYVNHFMELVEPK